MEMFPGQAVRRLSTQEIGVVIGGPTVAGNYDVAFGVDSELVNSQDLEPLGRGTDGGPLELLTQGKFGVSEEHDLYVRAAVLDHAFQYDSRSGLSNARIEPKLWQLFVMLRVLNKTQPRMILADEVGLGKTVEAGLLIKELRARKLADRVLVITPASLVEQWRHELSSKFNESFELFDRSTLDVYGRGKKNAFKLKDSIICSLPFALRHSEEILECDWDLVIIDEAHKVSRRRNGNTWDPKKSYDFAVELNSVARGLLLLTATPMQVHESQLYSLVDLVEPGLFGSLPQFMAVVRELPDVNSLMKAIMDCAACTEEERVELLARHAETLSLFEIEVADLAITLADQVSRDAVLTALAQQHPLADVMVRNRKREVMDGFQPRVPKTHPVEPTPDELALYDAITEYIRASYDTAIKNKNRAVGFLMVTFQKMLTSSSAALKASFEGRVERLQKMLEEGAPKKQPSKLSEEQVDELREAAETSDILQDLLGAEVASDEEAEFRASVLDEIQTLSEFSKSLDGHLDSKAKVLRRALEELFGRDPNEKVLIFTQFIETQMFLAELLEKAGFSVEWFNGTMTLEEKERAVRRFRESSQILVSTEAGGEGRNFQFCHVMVNYDLPWNPMRVEQRIGRIDRIGQKSPVEIHNLAIVNTLEEHVLEVLAHRIKLFEEAVGSLDPILGEIEKEFEQLAMSGRLDSAEAREAFDEAVEKKRREAMAREEAQADLAMDRNSFRKDEANKWLHREPLADWEDLRDFVDESLDYYGGRMSRSPEGKTVIAIAPALKNDIKASKAKYEGEFNPALALVEEDDEFFAMGHEVVDGMVRLASTRDSKVCGAFQEAGLTGPKLEILYQLLSRAGRPNGQLVRHRIGCECEVQSSRAETFPVKRRAARHPEVPAWVGDAIAASKEHLELRDLREFGAAVEESLAEYREQETDRATRIHQQTVERLSHDRRQLEERIAGLEEKGTDKQKKILPALQGALRKIIGRIEDEQIEYDKRVKFLSELRPDHSARVVAATLVVPE